MSPLVGVVSLDSQQGMGYRGDLLIRLKVDMAWFRRLTSEHQPGEPLPTVIMGRKTWESLPEKYRPLPGRKNYVLTRQRQGNQSEAGAEFFSEWKEILIQAQSKGGKLFVIGGAELFRLSLPQIQTLYVTEFNREFPADTFFPSFRDDFPVWEILQEGEENGIGYKMVKYERQK